MELFGIPIVFTVGDIVGLVVGGVMLILLPIVFIVRRYY